MIRSNQNNIILELLIAIVIRFVLLLLFITGQVVKTDNALQILCNSYNYK